MKTKERLLKTISEILDKLDGSPQWEITIDGGRDGEVEEITVFNPYAEDDDRLKRIKLGGDDDKAENISRPHCE